MTAAYEAFLASKVALAQPCGIRVPDEALPSWLFDFQRAITPWALGRGRAAIFAATGLGKTAMQLAWAERVAIETAAPVLLLAPLAVGQQTAGEAKRFGAAATLCREHSDVRAGINITNYDRLDHFDPSAFGGVVLDESSILKAYDGATRAALTEAFSRTAYRLACTATPAPNDIMELANHAEFLGVMTRAEMLATFFVHDGGETQKWRLKGHAESDFWRWMASWAVMFTSPADLGFDGERYVLPPLSIREHVLDAPATSHDSLFALEASTLMERRAARRASLSDRVRRVAELVAAEPDEPWLIWCDLNDEAGALAAIIPGATEVRGTDDPDEKESALLAFSRGEARVLVTKPSIAGFGMNWQHCARIAFCGVSDSWEAFHQAIRRCWRFGQRREVLVHVVSTTTENAVLRNLQRKERGAAAMTAAMVAQMQLHSDVVRGRPIAPDAAERRYIIPEWLKVA
ncbi:MAG: putative Helicase domain protein [Candidatus Eremiobacteraeota bacterium]|nr:putative Helicase domain protein [Candidatus Eremiobacteraeota bacterium]